MESRVHLDQFEGILELAKQGCLTLQKVLHKIVMDRTTDLYIKAHVA
jgi:hypothetical protein